MSTRTSYGFSKTVNLPFEQAVEKTKEALKAQGFGVLSERAIHKALKEKLNVDYGRYVILGACNPNLAYQGLQAEPQLGLLLPCNVTVRERGDGAEVSMVDAQKMLAIVGNDALKPVADDANQRLQRALAAIG
jgi:uncharacterized protein (DUF302 family)